jgi:drug/metabolite transporter (DMT)-like permease
MLILALAAALLYGTADFLGGVASRRATPLAVMAVTEPAGAAIVLLVALAAALLARGGGLAAAVAFGGWNGMGWAVAGGVVGAAGLVAFYAGFASAPMSVVAPVSALVSTILPVGVAVAQGERPSAAVIAGAVACLAAIVLVSATSGADSGAESDGGSGARGTRLRGLGYGVAAGVAFGLFFLFLKNAGHGGVLWPVAVSRVTGSLVALIALAVTSVVPLWRGGPGPGRRLLGMALISGAVDAAANVCYILATRAGEFGLAVVITSLYPGATVLLARLVLRERMRLIQRIGLLLAAAGIVLVTA